MKGWLVMVVFVCACATMGCKSEAGGESTQTQVEETAATAGETEATSPAPGATEVAPDEPNSDPSAAEMPVRPSPLDPFRNHAFGFERAGDCENFESVWGAMPPTEGQTWSLAGGALTVECTRAGATRAVTVHERAVVPDGVELGSPVELLGASREEMQTALGQPELVHGGSISWALRNADGGDHLRVHANCAEKACAPISVVWGPRESAPQALPAELPPILGIEAGTWCESVIERFGEPDVLTGQRNVWVADPEMAAKQAGSDLALEPALELFCGSDGTVRGARVFLAAERRLAEIGIDPDDLGVDREEVVENGRADRYAAGTWSVDAKSVDGWTHRTSYHCTDARCDVIGFSWVHVK